MQQTVDQRQRLQLHELRLAAEQMGGWQANRAVQSQCFALCPLSGPHTLLPASAERRALIIASLADIQVSWQSLLLAAC